ncbi:hypothetical protein [Burkholderia ambifaria]|uniref:hypothetical protein n=1 Tax=Burkholderia ambifaria TaxID=152480 RepID=UPI00158D477B|nr:hypothetical protein [Burkholderia ambifaria]
MPLLRKQLAARLASLRSVPRTTANRVVAEMAGELALRAQHFPMQIIPFDVCNRSAIKTTPISNFISPKSVRIKHEPTRHYSLLDCSSLFHLQDQIEFSLSR